MVLHIGCDAFVPLSSVVAVLDAASRPDLVSELSPPACGGHEVRSIGKGAVKSVVVTASGGRCVFFLSPHFRPDAAQARGGRSGKDEVRA